MFVNNVCNINLAFLLFSQNLYPKANLSGLEISEPVQENCVIATDNGLKLEQCQSTETTKDRHGICQYTACTTKDGSDCIFPFKLVI